MTERKISPALYLLPIGLSDAPPFKVIPEYNIQVMKEIRHFVVENVRTARRWIKRCCPEFNIDGTEFTELNTRTPASDVARMLDPLRQGNPIGVMSEAGCPAVADPGADIVAIAQKEGLKVVPLVGPSSILLGLMGSGFNGQSFCFHGYLPIDDADRRRQLIKLETESERENRTQIFIETPYRNNRLIPMMAETLRPDTAMCVACNLTDEGKELIITKTAAEWRMNEHDYSKLPAIFLIYRGLKKEGLIYSTKSKGKRR